MITYKDKSYCFSDCVNKSCYRYLNTEDKKNASELGLPISYGQFANNCVEYMTPVYDNDFTQPEELVSKEKGEDNET